MWRRYGLCVFLLLVLGLSGCVRVYEGWVLRERDGGSGGDSGGDLGGDSDSSTEDAGELPAVLIPAGVFTMGSPASEPCREPWSSTETQHRVTIGAAFYLHPTEVTQSEFLEVMGYNPSRLNKCGDRCPVERVSWHEAAAFCNALSERENLAPCYRCSGTPPAVTCSPEGDVVACAGYRLPTEAEWEYASRATSAVATYEGPLATCDSDEAADRIAWYRANSADTTHPVGQKKPNGWGLYDMAGNVWEWCHDWHANDLGSGQVADPTGAATGSHRVVRGGGWSDGAGKLRAAMRDSNVPDQVHDYLGFRWARRAP